MTSGATSERLLVIGGARSGKSAFAQRHAERRAARDGLETIFVATAEAFDDEMAARIAAHRVTRGDAWRTIEAPLDLAGAIRTQAAASRILLVDCLTLWLSNRLMRGDDLEVAGGELVESLAAARGPIVLVSNEVGWSVVPDNALARRFRDAQGRLNQLAASACDTVVLVAAGLPLMLKGALADT